MSRQIVIRVMLSLLLLVTQQMASAHAMSHLAGKLGGVAQVGQLDSRDLSDVLAQDQNCKQCLVFAQLGGPPSHVHSYFAPPAPSAPVVPARAIAAGAGAILAFQSRGPPQA